jgi:hypothetical protein
MTCLARARCARTRIDTWDEFYHNGYEHMIDIRGQGADLANGLMRVQVTRMAYIFGLGS